MTMGILGQSVNNGTPSVDEMVYTVPVGKVAVFNIFVSYASGVSSGAVKINDTVIGVVHSLSAVNGTWINIELKSIIGDAGTTVKFNNCSGIVTGYEEDA